ncbi:hypothetical protein J4423_01510 [Candidatus Pacearchaeota archaeon]|nr:hypothetical protein [Candidatus Pacearchaeota archaeon]
MIYRVKQNPKDKLFECFDASKGHEIRAETISGLISAMRFSMEMGSCFSVDTGVPIEDVEERRKRYALSPKHHAEFWALYNITFIQPFLHSSNWV